MVLRIASWMSIKNLNFLDNLLCEQQSNLIQIRSIRLVLVLIFFQNLQLELNYGLINLLKQAY